MSSSHGSSSSSASSTSRDASSDGFTPILERPPLREEWNDEFTGSTDVLELDISPEKKTSRQLFATGDATDNYVIDRISTANRGYCSLLVTGSSPFDMEFNLDETCAVAKNFESLPGTHRWMLYKDIVKGSLLIERGTYVSVTSIREDMRITCCVESVGPSDVLFSDPLQLYKLHRDFFRMPLLSCTSPISIDLSY